MYTFKFSIYGLALASLACVIPQSLAQPVVAGAPSVMTFQDAPPPAQVTPGKPVKKEKEKKEKPPKVTPLTIVHGVLTVDGWTAKADLNYAIPDVKFLYVWVPGTGTYVISNRAFPGATEVPDGFNGTMLTVTANKHKVQVVSDKQLLPKKKESAFVAVDSGYKDTARAPRLGYGDTSAAPYAYPGSLVNTSTSEAVPIPTSMRPAVATKTTCETLSDGVKGDCTTTALTMPTSSKTPNALAVSTSKN
jgi:hypothetical protein